MKRHGQRRAGTGIPTANGEARAEPHGVGSPGLQRGSRWAAWGVVACLAAGWTVEAGAQWPLPDPSASGGPAAFGRPKEATHSVQAEATWEGGEREGEIPSDGFEFPFRGRTRSGYWGDEPPGPPWGNPARMAVTASPECEEPVGEVSAEAALCPPVEEVEEEFAEDNDRGESDESSGVAEMEEAGPEDVEYAAEAGDDDIAGNGFAVDAGPCVDCMLGDGQSICRMPGCPNQGHRHCDFTP